MTLGFKFQGSWQRLECPSSIGDCHEYLGTIWRIYYSCYRNFDTHYSEHKFGIQQSEFVVKKVLQKWKNFIAKEFQEKIDTFLAVLGITFLHSRIEMKRYSSSQALFTLFIFCIQSSFISFLFSISVRTISHL